MKNSMRKRRHRIKRDDGWVYRPWFRVSEYQQLLHRVLKTGTAVFTFTPINGSIGFIDSFSFYKGETE